VVRTPSQFFMPDDDYFWWGQLKGETYRLIIANAEHSEATGIPTLLPSVVGFIEGLLTHTPRPVFDWKIDPSSGAITIVTQSQPAKVVMRWATTADGIRRDFRLIKGDDADQPCVIPLHVFGMNACFNAVIWDSEYVGPSSVVGSTYTYTLVQPLPDVGWRGVCPCVLRVCVSVCLHLCVSASLCVCISVCLHLCLSASLFV
jgi:hypothetical protein